MARKASEEKAEMERLLNELFEANIKWSRLSMEDLRLLTYILTNEATRARLCEKLQCRTACDEVLDAIEKTIPGANDRPIVKILKWLASKR